MSYEIIIVGAGPAGLSAAARAAAHDRERGRDEPSYLLLESFETFAKTIQRYQKGKHVMAEPGFLKLRSPMPFEAGKRESVLGAWEEALAAQEINIRFGAEVASLGGNRGSFTLTLTGGEELQAQNVVLAIGTQGNPRRLGVPGDDESDFVAYSLSDAAAFEDEDIVVVGAGDAAIENAIALAVRNRVTIVNRRSEFSRAKEGNLAAILKAINDPSTTLDCRYDSTVASLEVPDGGEAGAIVLQTPSGAERLPCHRIFARLGTTPPRAFVESCGIVIDSPRADALPAVDRHYQSNVDGLYLIGALGGYPLIKQAMNQGYEVVDFIHGIETPPADYELLEAQFSGLPYALDPEAVLALYQSRVPMFRRMNSLAFRELIVESEIILASPEVAQAAPAEDRQTQRVPPDHVLYRDGEYSSTFYTLVEGSADVQLDDGGPWHRIEAGQFFGEMSLISGRPRAGSAVLKSDSIVIGTPRRIMAKLMASNEEVRAGIDQVFVVRALQAAFHSELPLDELRQIAAKVEARALEAGDELYREGDAGDRVYLVRRGRIALARGDQHQVVYQVHSGELLGQLAFMGAPRRRETAIAAVRSEVLAIDRPEFLALAGGSGEHLPVLQAQVSRGLLRSNRIGASSAVAETMDFMIQQGMGEATNALLINENLCIGCDNCEKACAETHDGISRLNRRAKLSHNHWHVAQACLHCELPHCMKDCPTDAIRRTTTGEVFITDACIGCGNCESNCPYDAISLRYPAPRKPGLLRWLLFGSGPGPGDAGDDHPAGPDDAKTAVKCDACRAFADGYACVNACPTGAAIRVDPDGFYELLGELTP
jgi:Fe-S-cluster-containing hydrogenase component 2/CRP-like cAMP-binding protein/thioredoxin reductase